MNYELAKELKDAGFPCSGRWTKSITNELLTGPTLSELIEACGRVDVLTLEWRKGRNTWHVIHSLNGQDTETSGSTPEEAVARLWLAIHKLPN